MLRSLATLFLCAASATVAAQAPPAIPFADWLTDGVPGTDEITSVGASPVAPDRYYVGTGTGVVLASDDAGRSWRAVALRGRAGGPGVSFVGAPSVLSLAPALADNLRMPHPSAVFDYVDIFGVTGYRDELRRQFDYVDAGRLASDMFDDGFESPHLPHRLDAAPARLHPLGTEEFAVHAVEPHPADPQRALAATSAGLFETRDGGQSWQLIFEVAVRGRVDARHALYVLDENPRILVATQLGLYESIDGHRFQPVPDAVMATRATNWLTLAPGAAGPVALDGSVRAFQRDTNRFGRTGWSFQLATTVHRALFHPDGRIAITSPLGVFISSDGGDSWNSVLHPELFGADIVAAAVSPTGTLVVAIEDAVWESRDWRTFRQVAIGQAHAEVRMLSYAADGTLLVAWDIGVQRVSYREAWELPPAVRDRFVEWFATQPTVDSCVSAALERSGLQTRELERLGRRSRRSVWAPRLTAAFAARDVSSEATLASRAATVGGGLERTYRNTLPTSTSGFAVFASWDLARALYRSEELRWHPAAEALLEERRTLTDRVVELYGEWVRLNGIAMVDPTLSDPGRREWVSARLRLYTDLTFDPSHE